ncbi:hypothetical protein [Acuticoccus sediminis]|uniref:hypothetical protein n=1 Tax=Acuticoccus sediminis TaxID=2184697 RepID=UPI001CFC826E|nr:hypothetical protein [Acuticoccus sediminis]
MARVYNGVVLGTTSELSVPGINGDVADILKADALPADQSLRIRPSEGTVSTWVLGIDLYVPATSASYIGLAQAGADSADGDLFLHDNGAGALGVGISGQYDGAVEFDTWTRIVVAVTEVDGETVLEKYVDGEHVGTQSIGTSDRFDISPALGLTLFTDNDGETAPLSVSGVFFSSDLSDLDALLAAGATADAEGFLTEAPSESAVEIDFAGADVAPRYGDAAVDLEGLTAEGEPVAIGDSVIGLASELGLPMPGGEDIAVLAFDSYTRGEGLKVSVPADAGDLTSYTAVWDIYLDASSGEATTLLRGGSIGRANVLADLGQGIGVDGQYDGTIPADTWTRIAVSVEDRGDGTSVLSKYIDGVLVGTQTVDTGDFTLDTDDAIVLLGDELGQSGTGALAHFGLSPLVLPAAEIATLGTVDADGPFEARLDGDGELPTNVVRLVPEVSSKSGAFHTSEAAQTDGLTFDASFQFRATNASGYSGDGFAFRIDGADSVDGYLEGSGGSIGIPSSSDAPIPTVSVIFDFYANGGESGSNVVRIAVGTDSIDDTVVTSARLPYGMDNGAIHSAWVEYDGTTLSVYLAEAADAEKPVEPIISQEVDLAAVVGEEAVFGFSGATGANSTAMDIVNLDIETSDPNGPSGELLETGADNIELIGDAAQIGPVEFDDEAPMQVGFDRGDATVEFGFADADVVDRETVRNPIADLLVTPDAETVAYDLTDVFGEGAHDFAVTNSNGDVVTATIEDGVLSLDFGETLDHSDLVVTAITENGTALTDNVRVRVAGENAYTFAIIPDTQDYPTTGKGQPETMGHMMQWLAQNADGKSIEFVSSVGDIVNNNTEAEWQIARDAYDILRDAGISFSVVSGNHDIGNNGSSDVRDTDYMREYFSVEYMSADPTYGGNYDQDATSADNNYHLYTAPDGTDWIILNLEFGPRDDVLRWADDVLTEHAGRNAIVIEHASNNFDGRLDAIGDEVEAEPAGYDYGLQNSDEGAWDGETLWRDVVSRHSNVVFTFGGHVFGDGGETTIDRNAFGYDVYQMLVNYQNGVSTEITGDGRAEDGANGGNGAIRLVTIDPENDAIYTETYLTELDTYLTGSRETEEMNRDGLTGSYVGHEETIEDAGIGQRDAETVAKAGDDQIVRAAAGETTAEVTLSAAFTVDQQDDISAYVWTDADGNVVAEGPEATVALRGGVHDITLTVETAHGVSSTDTTRVIVETDATYFSDNFNDGDAEGWYDPSVGDPRNLATFGTEAELGLPAIEDGTDGSIVSIEALASSQAIRVSAEGVSGAINEYTLVYDLYVADGQGSYTSLFQTDLANSSDAELFIRNNGNGTGGVGISAVYEGAFEYDAWNRVAVTLSVVNGEHVMSKYINGELVGTQVVDGDVADGSRWQFDAEDGFYILADNDGETSDLSLSAFTFIDGAATADQIAALGGVDADGPVDTLAGYSTQWSFDGSFDSRDFGPAELELADITALSTPFDVKGSANSRGDTPGLEGVEGTLYDLSDTPDNTFIRQGEMIGDMVLEATLLSLSDGTMGVVFRYDEASGDHYRFEMDSGENVRRLVRVEGGEETVIAEETGGYGFYDDIELKVVAVGGEIGVSLDGVQLFGGRVTDAAPLGAGTVGVYSSDNDGSLFDDITVRAPTDEADAGADIRVVDFDGDGFEAVTVDASMSTGATPVIGAGAQSVTGDRLETRFAAGETTVEVRVGETVDTMTVDVVTGDRIIVAETFDDGTMDGWTIVDTTEFDGEGNAATGSADWAVVDGALVEQEGSYSRELTWNGTANASDVWERGWSPQGDGVFALHKGTYALYDGDSQLEDYAIEADVTVPTAEGGVGFMLNYVDADNYYKLEIDAHANLTTLVEVVDGYESFVGRVRTTYTPGETFHLSAESVDGAMQVTVDGHEIFAYDLEARYAEAGSAGVYAWGAAGATFDNVAIIDLSEQEPDAIVVDTLRDRVADDGLTSLREAILLANESDGADTIVFDEALAGGTMSLRGGVLGITDDVTIDGADVTIDANRTGRIFEIGDGTSVELSDLALEDGRIVMRPVSDADGGSILAGDDVALTLDGVEVTGSTAYSDGGAIAMGDNAVITIVGGEYTDNRGIGHGGVIVAGDGATLSVEGAVFDGNTSSGDGGVFTLGDDAVVRFVDIQATANIAWGEGGVMSAGDGASLTVEGGEFARNKAISNGGVFAFGEGLDASLSDADFTWNRAIAGQRDGGVLHVAGGEADIDASGLYAVRNSAGDNGGVFAIGEADGAVLDLSVTGSTLQRNSAGDSGGVVFGGDDTVIVLAESDVRRNVAGNDGGVIAIGDDGTVTLEDNVLRLNDAGDEGPVLFHGDDVTLIGSISQWGDFAIL